MTDQTETPNKNGAIFVAGLFLVLPLVILLVYQCTGDDRAVKINGIEASATIVGTFDTGNRYNRDPEVRIDMEVRVDGRDPYRASATKILSPVELHKYTEGAVLWVKVNPDDSGHVIIMGLDKDRPGR